MSLIKVDAIPKFEEERAKLREVKLPGWYWDTTGDLCIMINSVRIAVFANGDSETIDVTVDTLDGDGDYTNSQEWESYVTVEEALNSARQKLRCRIP